jgi:hypothetical protein
MAEVNIDYAAINTVVGKLKTAVDHTIVPELNSLKSSVDTLLTSSGGLHMQKSSPALTTSYQNFNTSLTNAVNGIKSFALQFTNIASQLEAMDNAIAESVKKSS